MHFIKTYARAVRPLTEYRQRVRAHYARACDKVRALAVGRARPRSESFPNTGIASEYVLQIRSFMTSYTLRNLLRPFSELVSENGSLT